MKTDTEYPFTADQLSRLSQDEREAVLAVAEYLTSSTIDFTGEDLSNALNLMKETNGCAPTAEISVDLIATVRRKFAAVFETAMELAEAELKKRGLEERKHFNFCLIIEPSYEDATHVTIVDYDKPICYLHQWSKAWHFGFSNLAELAEAVLSVKVALVNKVTDFQKKEIFVLLEGGVVHSVVDVPPDMQLTILDYDTEGVEKSRIEPSPVDGRLCVISRVLTGSTLVSNGKKKGIRKTTIRFS